MNTGFLCLLSGSVLTVFGAIRIFGFLSMVQTYKTLTPRQLMQQLVFPHMLLLLGLGLVAAALILFTRAAIIRQRRQHQPL